MLKTELTTLLDGIKSSLEDSNAHERERLVAEIATLQTALDFVSKAKKEAILSLEHAFDELNDTVAQLRQARLDLQKEME